VAEDTIPESYTECGNQRCINYTNLLLTERAPHCLLTKHWAHGCRFSWSGGQGGCFKSLRCRKFTHNLEKFEEFDDLMSISFMNIPCDTSECHKTTSFMVLFCTAHNSAIVRDTNDSFSSIKFMTSATTWYLLVPNKFGLFASRISCKLACWCCWENLLLCVNINALLVPLKSVGWSLRVGTFAK